MIETLLHTIGQGILIASIAVSSFFGIHPQPIQAPTENLGASIPVVVATFQTSLQSGITANATSMTLVSGTDKAGNALSGYICFNIDEGTSIEEFVCGTAAGTSVTSMLRGLDPVNGSLEVTALKKTHGRGASVKITNYPSLGVVSRILNGSDTLPNPITYAAGVTPNGLSDLTDKEYVLSVVSGGTVSIDKITLSGTAGETLAAGNLVYLKASDGRWWKTDADTDTTVENVELGIAQGSGTAGNSITGGVLVQGVDGNQSGLAANTIYYASNTAGGVSSTVGTKEVTIGVALTASNLVFAPRYNQQITEDQQDSLVGSRGTPSSTNKYLTQENTIKNTNDQSQATVDSSIEAGEANATTKKTSIAQSFIAGKDKISGVKLWKALDTGAYAGTVTVSLQADSASSPSGSNVASRVFTNDEWIRLPIGEFTALFSTEYQSLTIGSTYWIVVTTSAPSNTIHPNIGTSSAGGYASGSVKYNNTTDGWIAVSTQDFYFKTMEGFGSQSIFTTIAQMIPVGVLQSGSSLDSTSTPASFATTGDSTTTLAFYVPANTLTGKAYIELNTFWSLISIPAINPLTFNAKIYINNTLCATADITTSGASADFSGPMKIMIMAQNSSASQKCFIAPSMSTAQSAVVAAATKPLWNKIYSGTLTQDMTAGALIKMTIDSTSANTVNSTMEYYTAKLFY